MVRFVNDFFKDLDVQVIGINVAPAPVAWVPTGVAAGGWFAWPYPGMDRLDETAVDAQVQHAEETVAESGLDEDVAIGDVGDPVEVICRTAVEEDVDLIVVGATHKGWWRRLLEGSVATELQRDAPRPVLVVQ